MNISSKMFLRSVGNSKTQNLVSPPYIAHLFQDVSSFCENMKIKKIYKKTSVMATASISAVFVSKQQDMPGKVRSVAFADLTCG